MNMTHPTDSALCNANIDERNILPPFLVGTLLLSTVIKKFVKAVIFNNI